MAELRHSGKIAIVTGAAIGNGKAIAELLAREGAHVIIADLDEAKETVDSIAQIKSAGDAISIQTDITDEKQVDALIGKVKSKFGRIDILVNNAGLYEEEPFDLLSFEKWKNMLEINLNGLFLMSKASIPIMKSNNFGRIINMSSNTIWLGTPYLVHYVTTKMGIIGFTRALASEVGQFGITVNAITVGLTATQRPAGSRLAQGNILEHLLPPQAIHRAETPEDLAGIVSFLASVESSIITGQTINVDGGVARH
ncbi:MAG: SDR family NAD(P)-dependent oxidoreductase [Bacteroidota bacterium]|nr:SDR family NAD(P)-dependent oxidoreductase [Bacteroidota bacterium]MDP4236974.1 SDR family NAD(P)-dependent oxidoreductase [Bacteroidota bacterium]